MGHILERSISPSSRARKYLNFRPRQSLAFRAVVILSLLAFFQQQHLFHVYRSSLAAKYAPTTFDDSQIKQRALSERELKLQTDLLSHRDQWKTLGEGYEGKTYTYNNSVIKTFTPGRSPFRNCAPNQQNERWPTEIPGSLVFGGLNPDPIASNDTDPAFLPVQAYFMAASSSVSAPEWHLVTPLVAGGNILSLAKRLRDQHPYKHYHDIDSAFRPSFNNFLRSLEYLHSTGYCHDDVKPSNVFVASDTDWILGDLGNIREVDHPYHSSRLWAANGQLPDCRANDVYRAAKSYLSFVREASNDVEAFNEAFFAGSEGLMRLFWSSIGEGDGLSAGELRKRSEVEKPKTVSSRYGVREIGESPAEFVEPSQPGLFARVFSSRSKILEKRVQTILSTPNGEGKARWASLSKIFGIPVETCTA